ncbi:endo alpha-1,4 polygalactosaminidase [Streptomyces mangrovisoli]|uniref:endo alpha-1,4 polygalactosaminidase n=1 Tax=Streptomyces mangrovisoli TaxID=1428628 RepID=UPI003B84AF41
MRGGARLTGARTAAACTAAALALLTACGPSSHDAEGAGKRSPSASGTHGTPGASTGRRTPSPSASAPTGGSSPSSPSAVRLPPRHAGFDYQIGGAYSPPAGVRVVSRDRSSKPAPGLYNICYVNAFQAQPEERSSWPADLLLRDADGDVVVDEDWNEALLDIRTADKRRRVAERVDRWIDECAAKGFDAIEPDNYDSYTRSEDLITAADATAFITLLSGHAHARHLAIGQKNTAELARQRKKAGLDFAVAEECADYDECDVYAKAFDDRVLVIEYSDRGLRKALAGWGSRLSIVRRDVMVSTPGSKDYVREVK